MPRSAAKPSNNPIDLPQTSDTWYLLSRQLRTWLELDDGSPAHPHLLLLFSTKHGLIVGVDVVSRPPDAELARQFLIKTMTNPAQATMQKPGRPIKVQFEQEDLLNSLSSMLAEIGIECELTTPNQDIDQLVTDFEDMLYAKEPEPPGLLTIKDVTPEMLGRLFDAAAEFYRLSPWLHLTDAQPLAVEFKTLGRQAFVQLMGNAGLEFGLLLYWDWDDLVHTYKVADDPLAQLPPGGWRSMTYEDIDLIPLDDLEAIEEYGLPVAADRAYPLFITYLRDTIERPTREELIIYEALLQSIPDFTGEYLFADGEGDYRPVEALIEVETQDGAMQLVISYPAGELPDFYAQPLDLDFEPDEVMKFKDGTLPLIYNPSLAEHPEDIVLDGLRSQEKSFARSQADLEAAGVGHGMQRAQNLMYQAWEESDPERRISLAQQALELTPHCADAYVVLAEEEAESIEEALEYYQRGVQAGQESLGDDFFEYNAGHFWELVQTRPYMRARQGLAECLIAVGEFEKGLKHMREMLHLDPVDNLGVRYSMLTILLHLGHDDEARVLLDQYSDDRFAGWAYTLALLAFRRYGATPRTDRILAQAIKQNLHVPAFLIGRAPIPEELPPYMGIGEESEAIYYVVDHYNYWWSTRGAIDWLRAAVDAA